jgi:hypothetical protein
MVRCKGDERRNVAYFGEDFVIRGLAHGMPASLALWYLIYLMALAALRLW